MGLHLGGLGRPSASDTMGCGNKWVVCILLECILVRSVKIRLTLSSLDSFP